MLTHIMPYFAPGTQAKHGQQATPYVITIPVHLVKYKMLLDVETLNDQLAVDVRVARDPLVKNIKKIIPDYSTIMIEHPGRADAYLHINEARIQLDRKPTAKEIDRLTSYTKQHIGSSVAKSIKVKSVNPFDNMDATLVINAVIGGIEKYRTRSENGFFSSHLGLFSCLFDRNRGQHRAKLYFDELRQAKYDNTQKLTMIAALLKSDGVQLQKDVIAHLKQTLNISINQAEVEIALRDYCNTSSTTTEINRIANLANKKAATTEAFYESNEPTPINESTGSRSPRATKL